MLTIPEKESLYSEIIVLFLILKQTLNELGPFTQNACLKMGEAGQRNGKILCVTLQKTMVRDIFLVHVYIDKFKNVEIGPFSEHIQYSV